MTLNAHGGKDSSHIIAKYHRALETDMPLPNPSETLQIIFRLAEVDAPETVLEYVAIPAYLQELYTLARIAKDNYKAGLMAHIMDEQPIDVPVENRVLMIEGREYSAQRRVHRGRNS